MKNKLLVSMLVFLFALPLIAAPPQNGKIRSGGNSLTIDNTTLIDVNRILMFVTNHGNFGRDLGGTFGYDYGTWYPYTGNLDDYYNNTIFASFSPNYASGLWVGGTDSVNGDTLVTISEYSSEFVPGPMSGGTFMPDDVNFRVYKLYKDSTGVNANQDYNDYMMYAVPNQGAPTRIDTTFDTDGVTVLSVDTVADIIGDQFLWSVYNDADAAQHSNMGSAPIGIEVKQSVFGWKSDDPLGDIVYMRYRIYNKGSKVIENCNFSIWCDPDLGDAGDDFVGCDTLEGLGFVWNDNVTDQNYSGQPVPSMGFDFLQGPLVPRTTATADLPDGKMWGNTYADSVNLGMESFNKYINGTDPDNAIEAYNFMNGLNKTGQAYTYNGQVLNYVLSGDPVTGQGDIDIASSDRRWMQTTGPLTFRPGDSTEIYVAMVLGQAVDNKVSISLMRFHDRFAQLTYDNDWVTIDGPVAPVLNKFIDENSVTIAWGDTSEVNHGSYPFEGYTVYQGEDKTGPWKKIITYDFDNTTEDVFDEIFNPLTASFEFVKVVDGDNNGLKRSITITDDVINGGKLRNLTEYHYKVEAYTVDNNAPNGLRVQRASTNISLTPQMIVPDITHEYDAEETIPVTHPSGVSDGIITAIVINPDSLTGNTYQVVFYDTIGIVIDTVIADPINNPLDTTFTSIDIAWHLLNVTTGDTVLAWQTNQTGSDDYPIVNGFQIKVAGPALGFKSFQVVANGAGVVDPPVAGAFDFRDFPTPGGTNPPDEQQVGDGHWAFHTGDNGGSSGGGTRGPYQAFLDRTFRGDQARIDRLGIYDWEMRFTGSNSNPGVNGGYVLEAFTSGMAYWAPFELWRIGIGTPDDPSDDLRLIPWIFGDGGDSLYYMSSWGSDANGNCGPGGCEHSASGADNDPYTDWIYWAIPADGSGNLAVTGGDSAYMVFENAAIADPTMATWAYNEMRVMDRTVLINWNGDTTSTSTGGATVPSGYNQDLPEQGTVFRLLTGKPNSPSDVFSFTTSAPGQLLNKNESVLDKITTVPNPFYLFNSYSSQPGAAILKFHHLPTLCTISIYNLAGELIKTIEKNDASTAIADWDVLTENGLPVASGIYVYVVDAPGYGQKVGKMAIFVEQEVLKIY